MDLYTRMIVGCAMDSRMTRELVLNALRMAGFKRKPKPELIHHSDQGSQYCSHDDQALIEDTKAISSMSRKGNCWDSAPMESWFNSLKKERVFDRRYRTGTKLRLICLITSRCFATGNVATPGWVMPYGARCTGLGSLNKSGQHARYGRTQKNAQPHPIVEPIFRLCMRELGKIYFQRLPTALRFPMKSNPRPFAHATRPK